MSGLTNAWPPPAGGVPSATSDGAYAPCAQLDENVDSAELMARSDPMADASLPDIRARSRPGTAMAAMMPMMATTISNSINVKPLSLRTVMILVLSIRSIYGRGASAGQTQAKCRNKVGMGVIRSRVRQTLMMLAVARKDPPRHNQRLRTALAVENLY